VDGYWLAAPQQLLAFGPEFDVAGDRVRVAVDFLVGRERQAI